ncbi:hypothetical protein [Wolbachia endosymbiont (group A) of Rhinocyllus conicus]|uniref:hypothetical protein n=1 Tax=Wolbachia endosymbiont (group A) of Rhinocyllus conicus TaxID=2954053 RepID=UPI002226993A|nr:hypothetical protein [Wolbachia endosymbiont (group A) of Rhinocyllus conicus]
MENHAKESIKHKVVLPNSKTINIEGTNFKYEIHYDQLDDKDLLMIEKYANHIFRAYQEKYGLDINTDRTFKGFIYNNLTDLCNARPGHNTAYAGAFFHHYPHKSGSVAHDLTSAIESTLTLYNQEKRGIPYPEGRYTFITDVAKELKSIRLDDNQEESKKVESSDSGREEKSGQEEISPEKHQTINQEESNTGEKPETTINQEEPKRIEPSGEDEKSKVEGKKSGQEEISPEKHQTINQEESNTGEKPETIINQEEPKKIEPSGSGEEEKIKLDEEKSGQEEISPKTVLPNSKTINIEGTKFKYEIHYDQLDEKDLLTIEKYANYIFHAYQERYGLDINTDHTFKGFTYNNLTDLRHGAYANAYGHHYRYKSESIAHKLTDVIYLTLNLYNRENHGTPYLEDKYTFIRDVEKELKAIRLDDNQEESNTAEKPETTINQEEPKKIEPSGSGEEEKIKLDEEKSRQEEISPKTVLPHSKTINIEGTNFKYEIHYDQLDEKDLLTIEKYANYIFHAYQERYGLDMNTDHTVKGFTYNNLANLSDDDYDSITADYHEYHYHSESIANDLTTMIYVTLNLYNEKNYGTSSPRGEFIRDVAEELKNIGLDDNQGELNTEERPKTTINQEKQEKELKESDQQDVITTTDHPLDDYNHDYHLIG